MIKYFYKISLLYIFYINFNNETGRYPSYPHPKDVILYLTKLQYINIKQYSPCNNRINLKQTKFGYF